MGTREKNRWAEQVFTVLMRGTLAPEFRFPGGGIARRTVVDCLERLDNGTGKLTREKVVDFCVCQVYAISRFDKDYLKRWNVSHSFGDKALERFSNTNEGVRYYEDVWLTRHRLSRAGLLDIIRDRSQHPLMKFVYPESENVTKSRMAGTEAGMYVCSVSTLMWTPFSPVCTKCSKSRGCHAMTRRHYPELCRIREEEYRKGGKR